MTKDVLSTQRDVDVRSLSDETARRHRVRRQRWTGAVVLASTVIVAGAATWWWLEARVPDAQLLVSEGANADAVAPLDGQEITGRAEVSVGADGDIDSVAYRLVTDDGQTRFSGTAWSPPFTLSAAAAGDEADPLGIGALPPGDYVLIASVGFADGGRTEISAAFAIGDIATAQSEAAEEDDSTQRDQTDETEDSAEPEAGSSPPVDLTLPGPDSTGPRVPDGQLRPSGSVSVTDDGAVIEGLDISGTLVIDANDVVVRDTRVSGSAPYLIRAMPGTSGTLIEHVEVDGQYSLEINGCIQGPNVTVRHSEVRRCTDGAKIGSGAVYEYNWIHDPTMDDSGVGADGHGHHVDGLQSTGGRGIVIRGNRIDMVAADGRLSNAAILLKSDFGAISDCLIEGNWLNGGNYTVYVRAGEHGPPQGCVVRDNRFGRDYQYGLLSIEGDVSLSGNIWDHDGVAVQP